MLDSGKEYLTNTPEELLEKVKSENSHTKDLSLQNYMDNVAAKAINSFTKHHVPLPAKAKDILAVWQKIDLLKIELET